MKRTEDFREFTNSLHSITDSINVIPELPDDCTLDFLQKIENAHPIVDNPFEKSSFREGLAIWDSVFLPPPKAVSIEVKRFKDITPLRSINKEWETTKESLNMIGRPDGVHFLRPKGPFILDLMNDDIRMLQGAHILAHREPVDLILDEYTFGQTADLFLRNLIKLFIARKYNMLINLHPEHENADMFSVYGIEVFGSTDLRAPSLMAAAGKSSRLKLDKTVVAILGSVGIEPHPRQIKNDDAKWRESNKWSCLPTLVTLAGWECVDFITHSNRIEILGEPYYTVPVSDLQEMSSFEEFEKVAKDALGTPEKTAEVMTVEEWFNSEDFKKGLSETPQLPCPHCIRINEKAEGVVKRPKTKKPKRKLNEIINYKNQEIVDWVNYVEFMRKCISIGRTATAYALHSITDVMNRNRAFAKKVKKLKSISSLKKKYLRKISSGYVSEAMAIKEKIDLIKEELDEGSK